MEEREKNWIAWNYSQIFGIKSILSSPVATSYLELFKSNLIKIK